MMKKCPSKNEIHRIVHGLSDASKEKELNHHLQHCVQCRSYHSKLLATDALFASTKQNDLPFTETDKRRIMAAVKSDIRERHSLPFPFFRWAAGFTVLLFVIGGFSLLRETSPVHIHSFSGDCSTAKGDLRKNQVLRRGDVIRTSEKSECYLAFGGNIIHIPESSAVRLESLKKKRNKFDLLFVLEKGKIISNIEDKELVNSLIVKSGSLETHVKGTVFMVSKETLQGELVSVLSGKVKVNVSKQEMEVETFQKLSIGKNSGISKDTMTSADKDLYTKVLQWDLYHPSKWVAEIGVGEDWKLAKDAGILYLVSVSGRVQTIDQSSGARLWEVKVGAEISSDPVVSDGKLFVNSSDGSTYIIQNGSILKRLEFGPFAYTAPLLKDGILYLANTRGYVLAYDIEQDQVLWQKKLDAPVMSGLSIADDVLLIGTTVGSLHAFRLDGNPLWNAQLPGRFVDSPGISQKGNFIVANTSGNIYKFNSVSGALLWEKDTGVELAEPLMLVEDKLVLMGKKVLAYDLDGRRIWAKEIQSDVALRYKNQLLLVGDGVRLLDLSTGQMNRNYFIEADTKFFRESDDLYLSRNGKLERVN